MSSCKYNVCELELSSLYASVFLFLPNLFLVLDNDDLDFEEDEDLAGVGNMSRKEYLEKLKKNDPDFYATMMQSSDVMDLNSSGEDDSEEEDEDDEEERGGAVFQPPEKLEVCLPFPAVQEHILAMTQCSQCTVSCPYKLYKLVSQ